jgi:succinate dehydrogenase/fumarate reductase flavoprotein subunit
MLNMADISTRKTDVLVIGGGGAGARAALEASKKGVEVILCLKGALGTSGATGYRIVELAGFNVSEGSDEDPVDQYYKDMVHAALNMCDENLARIVAEEAIRERLFLEEIGVPFKRFDGGYLRFTGCFASRKRTHILEGHGHTIMVSLKREIEKRPIRVLENACIVKLISFEGRVHGAIGIAADGKPFLVKTNAVILAAGGSGRLFRFNMNPPDITGDGYALALHAGATFTNMEFMQFGLGTVHPNYNLVGNWLFPLRPALENARGENLLGKYVPPHIPLDKVISDKMLHFPFSSRDDSKYIEISVKKEIEAGRTTPHGGVFLNFSKIRKSDVNRLAPNDLEVWTMAKSWLSKRGMDIDKEPLEVAVFAHAVNGGVLIDADGHTDIVGLFAAGENAAGPHGADRLGGNMLVTSQVFGRRAGVAAAEYANQVREENLTGEEVCREEVSRILTPSQQPRRGRLTINAMAATLADEAWRDLVVVRSREKLEHMEKSIKELSSELLNTIPSEVSEIRSRFEVSALLDVARIMVCAASLREESRGSHYREDFPEKNDQRLGSNIFIRKSGDRLLTGVGSISQFRGGEVSFRPTGQGEC